MYLFLFLILFFLIVFVLRSFLLWRNTGVNPMTFGKADDAHSFNGKLFKIIAFAELIVVGINAFAPNLYSYLLPFWYLDIPYLRSIGWGLLVFSLVWIFISQLQMADSWRIGIDYERKTDLITHGIFAWSRNPIFLGILIADIGLFLVIPNAFILLITGLSFFFIHIQIRLEEAFLKESHGSDYEAYSKKTRRWI